MTRRDLGVLLVSNNFHRSWISASSLLMGDRGRGSLARETDAPSLLDFRCDKVWRYQPMTQRAARLVPVMVGAVPFLVEEVAALRVPSQVAQVVVPGVAVFMAADQPIRTWPNESLQDEEMDSGNTLKPAGVQMDVGRAAAFVVGQRENFPAAAEWTAVMKDDPGERPGASSVGHLIEALKTDDGAPLLRLYHNVHVSSGAI
jgi:hypothetical protein